MDKIAKLFLKISKKDKNKLRQIITQLQDKKRWKSLDVIKLKNSDLYRLRSGNFRIIFHKDKNSTIIDSIKLRNESTYKNL